MVAGNIGGVRQVQAAAAWPETVTAVPDLLPIQHKEIMADLQAVQPTQVQLVLAAAEQAELVVILHQAAFRADLV
jgi:hypothetical protein